MPRAGLKVRSHSFADTTPQLRINPLEVAFDVDSVVADTMHLFVNIVRTEYGLHHIAYEDITSYNLLECLDIDEEVIDAAIAKILDGTHKIKLDPIDGAVEVLARLGRTYRPLVFISARPHVDAIDTWLKNHLPLEPEGIATVATGSYEAKAEVLARYNRSVFVEDRLETCYLLESAGITPILFKQPWNREAHPFVEVASWHELESLIDFNQGKM